MSDLPVPALEFEAPPTPEAPVAPEAPLREPLPGPLDREAVARTAGHDWQAIDGHVRTASFTADRGGYTADDIDRYLGFDPGGLEAQARDAWLEAPQSDDPGTADWRGGYASALLADRVRGPSTWADLLIAAGLDHQGLPDESASRVGMLYAGAARAVSIAQALPGRREFIDAAYDLSGAGPGDPDYENARRNLIEHWHDTDENPARAVARASTDPDLARKLAAPAEDPLGSIGRSLLRAGEQALEGAVYAAGETEIGIGHLIGRALDATLPAGSGAAKALAAVRPILQQSVDEFEKHYADLARSGDAGDFVARTIGAAVPTLGEFVLAGVPTMLVYGALHGADAVWSRTRDAGAAAAGAAIGLSETGISALPFLGASGGLIRAAVKGAIGLGTVGGLTAFVDPVPDWIAGKGYQIPTLAGIGTRAAESAIFGALGGAFAAARQPRLRIIEPEGADHTETVRSLPAPDAALHEAAATEARSDASVVSPLAEGYRDAFTLRSLFDGLTGPVWRDTSGAGRALLHLSPEDRAAMDATDRIVRFGQAEEQILERWPGGLLHPTLANRKLSLWKAFAPHMPEWRAALASREPVAIMGTKIGRMIAYMEGEPGSDLPADHPLRPAALTLRTAFQWSRAWQERAIAEGAMAPHDFVENYYTHLWRDRVRAQRIFGSPSRARTRPTFREGIEAGLEPFHEHPLEIIGHSLTRSVIGWQRDRIIQQLVNEGVLHFSREQPSGDMTPIRGLTRRGTWTEHAITPAVPPAIAGATAEAEAAVLGAPQPIPVPARAMTTRTVEGNLQAFASPYIARKIEAWHGIFGDYPIERANKLAGEADRFMDRFNRASNALLYLRLALPLFHAWTIGQEVIGGGLGLAAQQIGRGQIGGGLKTAAEAAAFVPAARRFAVAGMRTARKLDELAARTPDEFRPDPTIQALMEGGFRHGKRQGVYLPGRAPGIIEAILRGSVGRQLRDELQQYGAFGTGAYEMGRLALSTSAPLFDVAIPLIKTGVNYENAQSWLIAHPSASPQARLRAMRQIVDNTDDRMGELNLDNVFWPRWIKRVLSSATISPSWWYGTARWMAAAFGRRLGRPMLDPSGWEWNPTATFSLAGLIVANAGINALYQWIKTATLPGSIGRALTPAPWLYDLLAARTGGITKGGAPARALLPGQQKEFFDWGRVVNDTATDYNDPNGGPGAAFLTGTTGLARYLAGKQRPIFDVLEAMMTGHDRIGHDIVHQPGGLPRFVLDQFLPIFVSNLKTQIPQAAIHPPEAYLGIREAPDWVEDPARHLSLRRWLSRRSTAAELRRSRIEEFYRQTKPLQLPRLAPVAPLSPRRLGQ